MNKTSWRMAAAGALAAMTLCMAQVSSAQRVGPDTIALFPKNIGEFAYANLKQARSQKWFPQLQEQMLPERFLFVGAVTDWELARYFEII